jgi:hypothetical protein
MFLWKFTMFQKSFDMFKTLKKSMWTCGFFVSKVFFPNQMFTKSFQKKIELEYIPQEGIMCSKHSIFF